MIGLFKRATVELRKLHVYAYKANRYTYKVPFLFLHRRR
jgi:hypothetical protein